MNLLLQGGIVFFEGKFSKLDVRVKKGIISSIGKSLRPTSAEKVVDCRGLHVLPGAIDAHVHFREPGHTHKEDFLSGSKAAAAGGVTTIFDMPNTSPPVVTGKDLTFKRKLAKKSLVNYGLYALGCKENQTQVGKFRHVPGIKVYMGSSTGGYLTDDLGVLYNIIDHAYRPVVVHAENEQLIKFFSAMHYETKMHHKMRDNIAAAVSVADASLFSNYLDKHVHIAHVSTKEEMDVLRKFKTDKISCEVTPHHLFLTESYFVTHGNYGKMNPPLRYEQDQRALWDGVRDGTVDIVATDHAPHLLTEKDRGFYKAPCGVPGVQTMIPLLLEAVHRKLLTLKDVARLTATKPAQLFGLEKRGEIKKGNFGDFTIVDLKRTHTIAHEEQESKCSWTPFNGMLIHGWPVLTIVNGTVVCDRGSIVSKKSGLEVTFRKV